MQLLAVYTALLTIGEFGAYLLGRWVEAISSGISLTVFLSAFFFVFWAAWRLAIRLT